MIGKKKNDDDWWPMGKEKTQCNETRSIGLGSMEAEVCKGKCTKVYKKWIIVGVNRWKRKH